MKYRIYKLPFQKDKTRAVWYVEENSDRSSGVFDSEGEAALYIYNLLLSEGH